MMGIEQAKIELHNAQFMGDLVTGTTAPRDMAACRRCVECGFEATMPGKAKQMVIKCPACDRESLKRKFRVRFNNGGKPHFSQIFYGNPYLENFAGDPDIKLMIGTQIGCNRSRSGVHITESFRLAIMAKTGFDFPMGELIPDLHLTEDEKKLPRIIDGQYWVIGTGKRPPFTSKFYPPERWQAAVSSLPDITFVQVGFEDGKPGSEYYNPKLYGDNVIDMVGMTQDPRSGIRDLFRLVYHAQGCLSLVSSLMHVAAGFHKPCVVVGGAREPVRFEMYPWHRYIHHQGAMRCEGKDASGNERKAQGVHSCWKESINACPNTDQGYPKCMMMIEPFQIANAVKSYYNGGMLEASEVPAKKRTAKKPVFKMVCNAHGFGGGERSAVWIANRMLLEGFDVHLIPSKGVSREFSTSLSPYVLLDSQEHPLTEECDIIMLYTNDMTGAFDSRYKLLESVNAKKKIMVLNYRLMQAGEAEWSKTWDRYIFLCSDLEREFLERVPECNSIVLPPPVDLQSFLDFDIGSLDKTMHIVRISSQGASKYPENIREIVERIHAVHPPAKFTFMGGHKSLEDLDYVENIKEYSRPVLDVLRKGSVFWYILPPEYIDNGPRVIMEAMAAGLPVIADNRGGAKDRIIDEVGYLCDTVDDHVNLFEVLNGKLLDMKGKKAKEYAQVAFNPDRWIEAILEDRHE
jgi:glycosyltransferase involved in cell wall biosynthesis